MAKHADGRDTKDMGGLATNLFARDRSRVGGSRVRDIAIYMQRHLPQVNHDALLPSHPAPTLAMAQSDHASVLSSRAQLPGSRR